ncbi:MAG: acetyl-CoA C-acetyltransferase, partial [Thermoleophilia bacterium]|nr:acetyl-CoA C-acetyltransferase [Thermoleophilia bacterium]
MTEAFIYDALRTPRGRGKKTGSLYEVKPVSLVSGLLQELTRRNPDMHSNEVDDVVLGCVTPVGDQGADIARTAVLASGFGEQVGGVSINRFCASGLEAVNQSAARVRSGWEDLIVAGGVESMSRVPMASDGGAWAMDPETALHTGFVPQGISADLIATEYGFTRDEADALAVESQRRAKAAWDEGRFARSIVPVLDQNGLTILDRDEHMRPETTIESLAALKPAFKEMGEVVPGFDKVAMLRYPHLDHVEHIHHAGNSSGIVDGAAAVLVGTKEWGEARGLVPRARIVATAKIGTDPTMMLTGPVPVTERVLAAAGMSIGDIDLFEVNEAFASVVLRFLQAFQTDPARVNVNGGAIAMGHPL